MKRWAGEKYDQYRNRIKEEAERVKEYLQGEVIVPGTGAKLKGRSHPHQSKPRTGSFLRRHRRHRNRKKKLAYASRRRNRL